MKLSACLMVKNEENQLNRCLDSIKEYCDEIIIVDTGSTDKTIEIAKEYTDKIYNHLWENDFSLHRNQSISYATGDWLLIIDADEELKIDLTKNELIGLLEKVPETTNSAAIIMEDIQKGNIVMRCNSARLFRKDKVSYKGRVHNQPIIEGNSVILEDIVLYHYGYDRSPERMKEKFERSKELLLKQYENNENKHVEFYLCQLYGQHKFLSESQEWGEKYYLKRDELGEEFNQTVYFTLVKSYMDTNDAQKAWEIITDFLKINKPDPDMALAISDFGARENRLDIMGVGCRRYLNDVVFYKENKAKMGGKFFFSMREDVKRLILYRLCMVCFQEGMTAFNSIKNDLHLFDKGVLNELEINLKQLGLSFLLDGEDVYTLPILKAI
jgi:glycosyltransferase involved in cell wall biosynthesis